jgi:hypothetical protein
VVGSAQCSVWLAHTLSGSSMKNTDDTVGKSGRDLMICARQQTPGGQ